MGVTSNCDTHHTAKELGLKGLRADAACVAVAAVHLREISDVYRMLESRLLGCCEAHTAFRLA